MVPALVPVVWARVFQNIAVRMSLRTAFSIVAVVSLTGVLLSRARGTIEILIKLGSYLILVYANTVELRFMQKHPFR